MYISWLLDIPNLKKNIDYGLYAFSYTADIKAMSIVSSIHFHFVDSKYLERYIRNVKKQWDP